MRQRLGSRDRLELVEPVAGGVRSVRNRCPLPELKRVSLATWIRAAVRQPSASSGLSEAPAVHHAPVVVEPLPCFGIVKRIIRSKLPRGSQSGHETGLLTVNQSMSPAVPCSFLALNKAKHMDQERYVKNIVHDVLKPPFLDDFLFIDGADRIICHQARFV